MLAAVLVAFLGIALVPSPAFAANGDPAPPGASTGSAACGWATGYVKITGCDGSSVHTTTTLPVKAWAGGSYGYVYYWRSRNLTTGALSETVDTPASLATEPPIGAKDYNREAAAFRWELWWNDRETLPGGWKLFMGTEIYIAPLGQTVADPFPAVVVPAIKASVCAVGGFSAAKGSWTVNGLSVFFKWAGLPPGHGWYWYGAKPGRVIVAAGNLSGAIGRVQLSAWPGNYGLDKSPQPAPMVKAIRVYSVDDMGCYVDIPISGGTVDAPSAAPIKVDDTSGVGSNPGDVLPPGGTDATPDPVVGAFDECGNVITDMWCYISKLPGWLFVPSTATTESMSALGGEFAGRAPIGWITLGKNLSDRVASGDSYAFKCTGYGGDGEQDQQGACGSLGLVHLGKVGGAAAAYVPFLKSTDPGGSVLTMFRPLATITLLAVLYMGIGVWIGKRVLSQAVS